MMNCKDAETRGENQLAEPTIGAAIEAHREFGPGLLKSACDGCVCRERSLRTLEFHRYADSPTPCKGVELDCRCRRDFVVEDMVVVQLKAEEDLLPVHESRWLACLKASCHSVGLLINLNMSRLRHGLRRFIRCVSRFSTSPRLCGLVISSAVLALTLPALAFAIGSDDAIVFYPGYATLSADGKTWTARVQGCVFEPEVASVKRMALVAGMRKVLGVEEASREAKMLDVRMRHLLVDPVRREEVTIRVGDADYKIGTSDAYGHVESEIFIPAEITERLAAADPRGGRWLAFSAVLAKGDKRRFTGRVQLIPPKGLSIVSDIDDTIKITEVRDRKAMMANTFLSEFQPVPGMAAFYGRLTKGGASVHFVSGGPWQLFEPIEAFRRKEGFPPGTITMKKVRLTSPSAINTLSTHEDAKRAAIEGLLKAFPERRFVLVGDSGEQDPEIYGRIAREQPARIAAVWIRNVTDEQSNNARFQAAMAGVAVERWRLFAEPKELDAMADALLK